MASITTRASFVRGRGYVNFAGANFFFEQGLKLQFAPSWEKVNNAMFGAIDKFKKDYVLKISGKLWGAWENLNIIFPPYIADPIPGASIFGLTGPDLALKVQGDNGDLITYTNAAITKVADLRLGVENNLFESDIEWTAIIGNNNNPEDPGAYHTRTTNAYSDAAANFAKTNFKRTRFSAAWGAFAGFTQIVPQQGIKVAWQVDMKPIVEDGRGTVDFSIGDDGGTVQAKMIPIGPTIAQIKTVSQEETPHGTLASAESADLVCTGALGSPVVTLKNAFLMDSGLAFDAVALRVAEATWESTRAFAGGVPSIISSVA